jgi:hypothetical protein
MRIVSFATIVLALLAAVPAAADPAPTAGSQLLPGTGHVGVVFTEDEVRVIRDYYEEKGATERGKGHKKGLPPGIAKNLERGKPLPPGIAKRSLPADLEGRLPRLPEGYERILVDGRVLLIEVATRVIRDILTDVMY